MVRTDSNMDYKKTDLAYTPTAVDDTPWPKFTFNTMRVQRLYVAFCISLCVLGGCYWAVVYPPSWDDMNNESKQQLFDPEESIDTDDVGDCSYTTPIEIPPYLGDPCLDRDAMEFLNRKLLGPYMCPTDARSYLSRYPIFNRAITVEPKIVVTPATVDDIRLCLKLAKHGNLTVTVRGGGHNPAGFSLSDGGLVIDMAFFNRVSFVDEAADIPCAEFWTKEVPSNAVVAQGGATWESVHPLLIERNRSIVGGGCPTVGVAGLALGGGIGWSSRHYGLVSDNLIAVRIVLPDAEVRVVDDKSDPDLMWALRGAGGSNFGVVTDLVFKTQEAYNTYLAGDLSFTRHPEKSIELMNAYVETILDANVDPRLTMDLFLRRMLLHDHSDKIRLALTFGVFFDGPVEEGVKVLQPFLERISRVISSAEACRLLQSSCSTPDGMQTAKKKIRDWLRRGGPFLNDYTFTDWEKQYGVTRSDIYWTSGVTEKWPVSLSRNILDSLRFAGIDYAPPDLDGILMITIEHLGGAIGKGPSLWKHKDAKALLSIESAMLNQRSRRTTEQYLLLHALKRWTEMTYAYLSPFFSGSYANYAYPEMDDWEQKYYGRSNYDKLVKIKSQIQDADMFNSPQRIQTHTAAPSTHTTGSNTDNQPESAEVAFHLRRSKLQSKRSDLCPDWMLNTAVPIRPTDDLLPFSDGSFVLTDTPPISKDDVRIDTVRGRNVVVTGGTGGIGFAAVLQLLRLGANVIATSQTSETCNKAEEAARQIFSKVDASLIGSFSCFPVALDDVESVQKLVSDISGHFELRFDRIDILILNAAHPGGGGWSKNLSGVSKSVAINHLGQFHLTLLLLQNNMFNPDSGRIVIQSTGAAFQVQENDLIDLAIQRADDADAANGQVRVTDAKSHSLFSDSAFRTYSAGKAMNAAFALELARRLRSAKAHEKLRVFLTFPPGTVRTMLTERYLANPFHHQEIRDAQEAAFLSAAEGALACVYASVASLDVLDYPPVNRLIAAEDFGHSTKAELLGVEKTTGRGLKWEYQKQPAISNYVLGCQVGSVAARFRNVNWMRTNTTCNLWNWSVETLNTASGDALRVQAGTSPLGDLFVENCQLLA